MTATSARRIRHLSYGAAGAALAVHFAHALGLGKPELDGVFEPWIYTALMWFAAIGCAIRVVAVDRERPAWTCLAAFLALWATGDLLWDFHFDHVDDPPWPNVADGFYLSAYAFQYAGILLLLRARLRPWRLATWLDGLIGGLAVAALGASFVFPTILAATEGEPLAVVVTLAYPLLDCLALAFVILAFGLCGWRPGRVWLLLGGGFVALALADGSYNYLTALDTYESGGLTSALWPAGALLISLAAWQPPVTVAIRHGGLAGAGVATASALVALGVLVAELLGRDSAFGGVLALGAVALMVVRCLLTVRENDRILARSEHAALTDALSGLPNRRSLIGDLSDACESGAAWTLAFFDLDGFKTYNDAFGHGAGDALLARLGARLDGAVAARGRAYRLGGDEFCVLARGTAERTDPLIVAAAHALREHGEHFAVSASFGLVKLPAEAHTPEAAMGLADERMYADKRGGRPSSQALMTDVLVAALREREHGSSEHHEQVAVLAGKVARQLGCANEQIDEITRAAALHDVGKVAIPDAILSKPGPLDEDEWSFMRQHTIIGERILASAPPLRPIAAIVRASHERFDGSGYPDGTAGEDIPLASRVVAVCDAYHAMIEERSYRPARTRDETLRELHRCAGTQFDPAVVEAFARALAGATSPAAPTPGALPR